MIWRYPYFRKPSHGYIIGNEHNGLLEFYRIHSYPPLGGDVAVGCSTGVGRRRGSATRVQGLGVGPGYLHQLHLGIS